MDTKFDNERLEKDIIRAFQARGLREQMQQWEEEKRLQQQKLEPAVRPLWHRLRKVVYPIAVAAMLCGVIYAVVPASTWHYAYRMAQREYARFFHQEPVYQNSSEVLLALASNGIEEIGNRNRNSHILGHDDPMFEVVTEMNVGHYRSAQSILDDIQSATDESNPRYDEIMDDVDYLYALCELGRGQRQKAYRQLTVISVSHSRHARQATELLKHFK